MYESLPIFTTPPPDALLWRYLDFTKFVSLLESESLYFTRSDRFDDPFEGLYPAINISTRNEIEGLDIGSAETTFKSFKKYMAINCWHENPYESAAMWKLYLKSNEGIAISTTFKKLSESITDSRKIFIGRVKYIDYENEEIDASNMFSPFLHKRTSFEHEREVRAIYNNFLTQSGIDDASPTPNPKDVAFEHGINVSVDLQRLIHRITVSPDSPEWIFNLVKSTVDRFGFSFDVSQSSMNNSPLY